MAEWELGLIAMAIGFAFLLLGAGAIFFFIWLFDTRTSHTHRGTHIKTNRSSRSRKIELLGK